MGLGRIFSVAFFTLIFLTSVYAQPSIPHQFYGFVTINGAAADNASITAEIGGTEFGNTVSINGNYGIEPGEIFFVHDPNGNNTGKEISFFINDSPANQGPVTFQKGGYTMLNLSLGTEPFCGDGFCSAGETTDSCPQDCGLAPMCGDDVCDADEDCSNCPADCGECGPVCGDGACNGDETADTCPGDCGGGTPGGGSPGGGSPGGGGGGGAELTVGIQGNCAGQEIVVEVLNDWGNPANNSTVKVRQDNATLHEDVTGDDGIVTFVLNAPGSYSFITTRNMYRANYKTIEIVECAGNETGSNGTSGEGEGTAGEDLCINVNCDDQNPCTNEFCVSETGHCSYTNQVDGVACGEAGQCIEGKCVEPGEETLEGQQNGVAAGLFGAGFFGLSSGQATGLGIVLVALIALAASAAAYLASVRKKK